MKKFYLLIISILIFIISTGCGKQVFNGNRTGNDEQFIMDYSILNKTETHEMNLKEGDTIDVIIESKSGKVDVVVSDSSGKKVYVGHNASSGEFSFEIPKTDTYKFSITGRDAKGSVSFKVAH